MTDNPNHMNYSSNSNKSKKPAETVRVVPQVTSGSAQLKKKSVGSKFRESFTGDDAKTVGQYLLFDVIVPSIKDLLFSMIVEGGKRALFGGSGGPKTKNPILGQSTNYTQMYSGGGSTLLSSSKPAITAGRATFDYKEVIVENRGEAEAVVDALQRLIDEYGNATVADLYACVGVSPDHTAIKWGWTSLQGIEIHPMQQGYLIRMPQVGALA